MRPPGSTPDLARQRLAPMQPPMPLHWPAVLPEELRADPLARIDPRQWPASITGDPDRLGALVTTLRTTAARLDQQRGRITAVDVGTFWHGNAAKGFQTMKSTLPPMLAAAEARYSRTAAALGTYRQALSEAQQSARLAARDGSEAKADILRCHQIITPPPPPAPIHSPTPIQPPGEPITQPLRRMHTGAEGTQLGAGERPAPGPGSEAPEQQGGLDPQTATGPAESTGLLRAGPPYPIAAPIAPPNNGVEPPALREAIERFAGAMAAMHRAQHAYDDASARASAAINEASADSLRNSAAYNSGFARLKRELETSVGGISPELRKHIAGIGSVAGLLGYVTMAAAMSKDKPAAKALVADSAAWRAGHGDGAKVVRDFLAVLAAQHPAKPPVRLPIAPIQPRPPWGGVPVHPVLPGPPTPEPATHGPIDPVVPIHPIHPIRPEPIGGPIDPIHPIRPDPPGGTPIVFGHEHPDSPPPGSGGGRAWPEGIQPTVAGTGSVAVVPLSTGV